MEKLDNYIFEEISKKAVGKILNEGTTSAPFDGDVAQLVNTLSLYKIVNSVPVLGITTLCPKERHLTLIFQQILYVVGKHKHRCLLAEAYIGEILKNQIKKYRRM